MLSTIEYTSSNLSFVASVVTFLFTVIHYKIFKYLILVPAVMLVASILTLVGPAYHEVCVIFHNLAFLVVLMYILIGRITLPRK